MVSMRTAVVGVLTALALAGCSSSSSGSGPTITSFTATPSTVPTAGGSVTLAWVVTGATTLSIDQGVGSVSPVTSGSATAQVTATTTFTLTATNSGGSSTSTAQVTVQAPITVAGTVVDRNGAIAAGESVLITSGTFSANTVSGADGTFSIAHVPTPYTATVLDSGGQAAVQYVGLTRTDPSLVDLITVPQTRSSMVAGNLTGGQFPESGEYDTTLRFFSPQTTLESSTGLSVATDGTFSGGVVWLGPTETTGTLYALQIHTPVLLPTDYPGYGTLPNVLLQDMGSISGKTIPMSPVTSGTLSGTVTMPAGFSVEENDLYLVVAPDQVILTVGDSMPTTSFSYTAPSISGTSLTMLTTVDGAALGAAIVTTTGLTASSTGVAVNVPSPSNLTLPVDSATGVTTTTPFSWTDSTAVYVVAFSSTSGPTYYVFTAATTATIPDLSAAGLPLPTSTSYSWQVLGFGPNTSVDAAAIPGGIVGLELTDGYIGESPTRSFTTGP
jgi:hypothetical protein